MQGGRTRQVGMDMVVILGSLSGVMVSTQARNAIDMGSIPILGTIFRICYHTHDIYIYYTYKLKFDGPSRSVGDSDQTQLVSK